MSAVDDSALEARIAAVLLGDEAAVGARIVRVERTDGAIRVVVATREDDVVLELFDAASRRPRWIFGARIALAYRASEARSPSGFARLLASIERSFRANEPRDDADLILQAIHGTGATPPRPTALRQAPWRAVVSHYHEGRCPGPEEHAIQAAIDLGFLERLRAEARTVPELSRDCATDEEGTFYLLRALHAMGVVRETEGRFALDPDAATLVGPDRDVLLWRREEAARWRDLARWVKHGRSAGPDVLATKTDLWLRAIGRMQSNVEETLASIDLTGVRSIVDVGSGSGNLAIGMLRKHPSLRVTLVDYPQSIPVARDAVEAAGMSERATCVAAEFFDDAWALPRGHDLVWIASVLHAVDRAGCESLLRRATAALSPGGRVVVLEQMSDAEGVRQRMNELNYFLFGSRARGYYAREIAEMLRDAGLADITIAWQGTWAAVVEGRKR